MSRSASNNGDLRSLIADRCDLRFLLHERLELWIDEALAKALAEEDLPEGLDEKLIAELEGSKTEPSEPGDLYSVWSAMTALTQEVKLQGRTFGQLNMSLSGLSALPAEVREALERDRPDQDGATPELEGLLDIRDRLVRGESTARRQLEGARDIIAKSVILRLFGGTARSLLEAVEALREGYWLSARRLDELLEALGVDVIEPSPGDLFDPHEMRAIEAVTSAEWPEGTICEVARPGYRQQGTVLRYCEVVVVRETGDHRGS